MLHCIRNGMWIAPIFVLAGCWQKIEYKGKPVAAIVRSVYEDVKASEWLAGRTSIPAILLPHTVGSVPGADDLFGMFDVTVKTLVEAQQ